MGKRPQGKSGMAPTRPFLFGWHYELALAKIAVALARWGATPNRLTYASLVLAIASGVGAGSGFFLIAATCLLASGVFDLLDGSLARATNNITVYGALLDSTLDRLSDAAPLVGLIVFFAPSGWVAVIPGITFVGAYLISYVRARTEALGGKLPRLWMRRSDRLIMLSIALLLGAIQLPGVHFRAPLTMLIVAVAGVLNMWAFIAALSAARTSLGPESHRAS